jgi:hypothetical protein
MISFSMFTKLLHNTDFSDEGKAILTHAVAGGKAFLIVPMPLTPGHYKRLSASGLNPVITSNEDWGAIAPKSIVKAARNNMLAAMQLGEDEETSLVLNVYPNKEYVQLSDFRMQPLRVEPK